MKAVILAAGKGERLKATVDDIPKPMIEYKGKPVLQHNVELCARFGIRELFINTHHLPHVIKNYFGDGRTFGVKIEYSFEETLLGTAGELNNVREQLSDGPFFVLYGDNCSDFDLGSLEKEFQTHGCIGVIGFHYREDVSQSGVGEFASDGRITRFVEKPVSGVTACHWVNAGVCCLFPREDHGSRIYGDACRLASTRFGNGTPRFYHNTRVSSNGGRRDEFFGDFRG